MSLAPFEQQCTSLGASQAFQPAFQERWGTIAHKRADDFAAGTLVVWDDELLL
jgi:hypothetical protein